MAKVTIKYKKSRGGRIVSVDARSADLLVKLKAADYYKEGETAPKKAGRPRRLAATPVLQEPDNQVAGVPVSNPL